MTTRITDLCDRCGAESARPMNARLGRMYKFELKDEAKEPAALDTLPVAELHKDLCRQCAESLHAWFKDGVLTRATVEIKT